MKIHENKKTIFFQKFPILSKKVEIEESLKEFDVTIIITPTSSGKTMVVPFLCSDISGEQTYCLQPRVYMSKKASEGATKLSNARAGYMTGRGDSLSNFDKVIYCTEGSFLARNIAQYNPKYICVDEVHEMHASTEKIYALSERWIKNGTKMCLMSATLDPNDLILLYLEQGFTVNVVEIPEMERSYKINYELIQGESAAIKRCFEEANGGGRVLIGVEGKGTIAQITKELQKNARKFPIFALHGEVDIEELDAAFKHQGACIYIATPIIQSGITLNNLTLGYFNGIGKRIVNVSGINTLKAYQLSKEEILQWHGRIGRTQDGTVLVETSHSNIEEYFNSLVANKTPEAKLINPTDLVLDFATHGLDISKTPMLNRPSIKNLQSAFYTLQKLNLIDENNEITIKGSAVASMRCGFREAIIKLVMKTFGLQETGEKLATTMSFGSPFTFMYSSDKSKLLKDMQIPAEYKFSEHLLITSIIDQLALSFNGRPKGGDKALFDMLYQSYGYDSDGYRRGSFFLKKLFPMMEAFNNITKDDRIFDEQPENLETAVKAAFLSAYADKLILDSKITLNSFNINSEGTMSHSTKQEKVVQSDKGDFVSMGTTAEQATAKNQKFVAVGDLVAIETRRGTLYICEMFTDVSDVYAKLNKAKE